MFHSLFSTNNGGFRSVFRGTPACVPPSAVFRYLHVRPRSHLCPLLSIGVLRLNPSVRHPDGTLSILCVCVCVLLRPPSLPPPSPHIQTFAPLRYNVHFNISFAREQPLRPLSAPRWELIHTHVYCIHDKDTPCETNPWFSAASAVPMTSRARTASA